MKKRKILKKMLLVFLIIELIIPEEVNARRRIYSTGRSADLEHPYNWVDYSDDEVEAQILSEQKKRGSKDNFVVNYYTVREMVLNDKYDESILSKKYLMMDEYFRFQEKISNSRPFFKEESEQIVQKIGLIDQIIELDDGSVVFTLQDNPEKRFLIMPGYDYFHLRYVTKSGDKVSLLTTIDRKVYEFENLTISRGQDVNYLGHMNYAHPEDMIIDGYFPSKLYEQRLRERDVHIEPWLNLMLEYVDVEEERYSGYCDYTNINISKKSICSMEEYYRMRNLLDSVSQEFKDDAEAYADTLVRMNSFGFDYDAVNDKLDFTYGEIREIKSNINGETVFTLWEEPTKWYYMSKYYDSLHLGELSEPGDHVYVIHTYDKIVYGFNNNTIFESGSIVNNPYFLNDLLNSDDNEYYTEKLNNSNFWKRVGKLPNTSKVKYEKFKSEK